MKDRLFKIVIISWLIILSVMIVKGVDNMAHEKVYAVCENMCMEETMTREQINDELENKSDTSHNHDSRYYTESESDAKYKLKGDFAVITGSGTIDEISGLYENINLPSGFTITNCVIVSFMYGTDNNRVIKYNTDNISSISLNANNNKIEMYICDTKLTGQSVNYTIVLMKIS